MDALVLLAQWPYPSRNQMSKLSAKSISGVIGKSRRYSERK